MKNEVNFLAATFSTFALTLAACSHSGGSAADMSDPSLPQNKAKQAQNNGSNKDHQHEDKKPGQQDPDRGDKSVQIQALSAADKASLLVLLNTSSLRLPDANLYFAETGSDAKTLAAISQLNAQQRDLVAKVNANCALSPANSKTDGDSTKIGQPAVTTSALSIGEKQGAIGKCPVIYSATNVKKIVNSAISDDKKTISGTINVVDNMTIKYADADLAALLDGNEVSQKTIDVVLNGVQINDNQEVIAGTWARTYLQKVDYQRPGGKTGHRVIKLEDTRSVGHLTENLTLAFDLPELSVPIILKATKTDKADWAINLNGESYTADRLKTETGIVFTGNIN